MGNRMQNDSQVWRAFVVVLFLTTDPVISTQWFIFPLWSTHQQVGVYWMSSMLHPQGSCAVKDRSITRKWVFLKFYCFRLDAFKLEWFWITRKVAVIKCQRSSSLFSLSFLPLLRINWRRKRFPGACGGLNSRGVRLAFVQGQAARERVMAVEWSDKLSTLAGVGFASAVPAVRA